MLDPHRLAEGVMVFIIAFLINQHLQLRQEYESLKASCGKDERSCQHHCYNDQKLSGLVHTSTTPNLLVTTSSSQAPQQGQELYWMDLETSSESLPHDANTQSMPALSVISSSYPPDTVINARETGTVQSELSDADSDESRSRGADAVAFIPETELVSEVNVPLIQSSNQVPTRTQKDFEDISNSNLQSSDSVMSSIYTPPTSSASSEKNDKEEMLNNQYDYDLPVKQTHSPFGLEKDSREEHDPILSITVTEESPGETFDSENVFETSVRSDFVQAVMQPESTYDIPLHKSLASSKSPVEEDVAPLSTKAHDIHADESETTHEAFPVVSEADAVPSPHEPFSSDHESTFEPRNFEKTEQVVDFNEVKLDENLASLSRGTSALCKGTSLGRKHCSFQNICYSPAKNDFIFFKGPDSVVEHDSTLSTADVFTMSLSTLSEHNALMFSLVTLPAEILSTFSLCLITTKSIAVTRFKPDNLMHVLHDDVFPLYRTLRESGFTSDTSTGKFDAVILFTDNYDEGDYYEIYSSLSSFKPLSRKELAGTQQLMCFADMHIGLSTSTVWYQYGFYKPQGPLPDINKLAFPYIQEASQHLVKHFHAGCFLCKQKDYLVLLSRKDNRLILNEGELIVALSKSTRLKVLSVSLETQSLADIITIVKSSRGVIGMHGSLMVVSVFLPPGGLVIELFPFAVNPSRYTPFKAFAELPGSFLIYESWMNADKKNSVPHPDWTPEEGGIVHLPREVQTELESQEEVPVHLCCDDPSWLYHIYQDTYVNISSVVALTMQALKTQLSTSNNNSNTTAAVPSPTHQSSSALPDIPGSVQDVRCERNPTERLVEDNVSVTTFTVSWIPHWAFKHHPSPQKLRYEVVVQEQNSDDESKSKVSDFSIDVLSYTFDSFSAQSSSSPGYNVWITVIGYDNNGTRGRSKHVLCQ